MRSFFLRLRTGDILDFSMIAWMLLAGLFILLLADPARSADACAIAPPPPAPVITDHYAPANKLAIDPRVMAP